MEIASRTFVGVFPLRPSPLVGKVSLSPGALPLCEIPIVFIDPGQLDGFHRYPGNFIKFLQCWAPCAPTPISYSRPPSSVL